MAFESITDDKIEELVRLPKKVVNSAVRQKIKGSHKELNYKVQADDDSSIEFNLYVRQNIIEGMEDDYSCGISWIAPNGEVLTLRRYNGSSHNHPNHLEKEKLGYTCHVHQATEKYIKANRKVDGYATATDKYNDINKALICLLDDCNISGLKPRTNEPESLKLFEE